MIESKKEWFFVVVSENVGSDQKVLDRFDWGDQKQAEEFAVQSARGDLGTAYYVMKAIKVACKAPEPIELADTEDGIPF